MKDFDGVAMKGEALNSLTQATGEVDEDAQVRLTNAVFFFFCFEYKRRDQISAAFETREM